jgi:hypothetical protein
MSMAQVEDFRQHGYVVMDGLLTKETAARIKSEAIRLTQKGVRCSCLPYNQLSLSVVVYIGRHVSRSCQSFSRTKI